MVKFVASQRKFWNVGEICGALRLCVCLLGFAFAVQPPAARAGEVGLVQAISYGYQLGGQTRTGVFRLYQGGIFADSTSGNLGVWAYVPSYNLLVLQYATNKLCGSRFLAQYSNTGIVLGRVACTDGSSSEVAPWSGAVIAPFQLSGSNCPRSHCDERNSDWIESPPPADAEVLWNDPALSLGGAPMGSQVGLGCSSNGAVAACTFGEFIEGYLPCAADWQDTLAVFGYSAATGLPYRKWSSGSTLNCRSFSGVPLVGADGGLIHGDDTKIVRFDPEGKVLWSTPTPGGIPTSLVLANNGIVFAATVFGPLSSYDNTSGRRLAVLNLTEPGDTRYYTTNTPAIRGNRAYVITNHSQEESQGRLYAIDIADNGALSVAWYLDVGGPAGASPLVEGDMIYFDGDSLTPTSPLSSHIFAVRDEGASGTIVWTEDLGPGGRVRASFAADPRGGFWVWKFGGPLLRFDYEDLDGDDQGDLLETIDLDPVIDEEGVHWVSGAMTVYEMPGGPVLVVPASVFDEDNVPSSGFLTAIDLTNASLLWKVALPSPVIGSQFPSIEGPFGPRIMFTNPDGVWAVGEP